VLVDVIGDGLAALAGPAGGVGMPGAILEEDTPGVLAADEDAQLGV
jgi:hypothetical protein